MFPSSYAVSVLVATGLAAPASPCVPDQLGQRRAALSQSRCSTRATPTPSRGSGASRASRTGPTRSRHPTVWGVLQSPRYAGKMTQLDDGRDVIGIVARLSRPLAELARPTELAAAKADAISAKRNLRAYLSAPVKGQLISGDVWIAQLWNGDATQARVEQPAIEYALPREGSTIWADTVVMPRSAPHRRAAHEFMNYILRPEVGAAISDATGYGTPNQEALRRMEHPVPYPTPEPAVGDSSTRSTWGAIRPSGTSCGPKSSRRKSRGQGSGVRDQEEQPPNACTHVVLAPDP